MPLELKHLFIIPTQYKFLKALGNGFKEKCCNQISLETKITSSHAATLTKRFEQLGLISREKRGRRKLIILTSDGKMILDCLNKINEVIGK